MQNVYYSLYSSSEFVIYGIRRNEERVMQAVFGLEFSGGRKFCPRPD